MLDVYNDCYISRNVTLGHTFFFKPQFVFASEGEKLFGYISVSGMAGNGAIGKLIPALKFANMKITTEFTVPIL